MVKAQLKIVEGKFVAVRKLNKKPTLCAIEPQKPEENAPFVDIKEREGKEEDQKNQIAFSFYVGNDRYRPKADGERLTLERTDGDDSSSDADNIPDSCWFVKEGTGDHYHLRTLVEPKRYISRPHKINLRQWIFILSDSVDGRARVSYKRL